jgi:hypothetical protein
MKYYSLHESIDPKIIGPTWPQCESFFSPEGYLGDPYSSFTDYFDKLDHNLKVGGAILNSRARVTDLISNAGFIDGKIISSKLKKILEASNCKGIAFFPITLLINRQGDSNYWVIKSFFENYNFLDIKKCEFIIKKVIDGSIEKQTHYNTVNEFLEAFMEVRKNNVRLKDYSQTRNFICTKIVFNSNNDLDFFSFCPGKPSSLSLYISERFKEKIESENCTGCRFVELDSDF